MKRINQCKTCKNAREYEKKYLERDNAKEVIECKFGNKMECFKENCPFYKAKN